MSDGRLPARRGWLGWIIGLAIVLLVLAIGWVLIRGYGAVSELQSVRNSVSQLRSAVADRQFDRADRIAPRIAEHASLAHDLTSDPVWRGFEFIPWLGTNLTAVREIAEVVDDVAEDAVTPVAHAAREADLTTAGYTGSRIDAAPLAAVHEPLAAAAAALSAADLRAQRIDANAVLPPLADAVRETRDLVRDAASTVGALSGASEILPAMLGDSGARTFLLAVQNNAELRSAGGTVNTLILIRAENGTLTPVRTVNARDIPLLDAPLELDETTIALFGDAPGRAIRDATAVPDFAGAGATLALRWQQQYGETVDTVVAVDLVAIRHLVDANGGITFGDFTASADTIVPILASELPATVPDPAQQDAVFAQAVTAVLSAVLAPDEPADVLGAVAAAAADDRVRIWSAHPEEQELLAASALGGTVPVDDDHGTHVGVLLNDATGGKMDFYADASISTSIGVCDGTPTTQVTVTWTNDAPADQLPPAITGSSDLDPGSTRTKIAVYGPEGSDIRDSGNDEAIEAVLGTRPVVQREVTLERGEATTFTVSFTGSGTGAQHPQVHHTPMLEDPEVVRGDLDCG